MFAQKLEWIVCNPFSTVNFRPKLELSKVASWSYCPMFPFSVFDGNSTLDFFPNLLFDVVLWLWEELPPRLEGARRCSVSLARHCLPDASTANSRVNAASRTAAAPADLAGILDLAESIPLCVFVADAAETFVATGFVLWRKKTCDWWKHIVI